MVLLLLLSFLPPIAPFRLRGPHWRWRPSLDRKRQRWRPCRSERRGRGRRVCLLAAAAAHPRRAVVHAQWRRDDGACALRDAVSFVSAQPAPFICSASAALVLRVILQPSYIANPVGLPPGRPAPSNSFRRRDFPPPASSQEAPPRRNSRQAPATVHPYPPNALTGGMPAPFAPSAPPPLPNAEYYAAPSGTNHAGQGYGGYASGERLQRAGSFRASFSAVGPLAGAEPVLKTNPARVRLAANGALI